MLDKITFQLTFNPKTKEEVELLEGIAKMGRKKAKFILSALMDKDLNLNGSNVDYEKIREIIKEEIASLTISKNEDFVKEDKSSIPVKIEEEIDNNTEILLSGLSAFGSFGE